jgi:hypothetical protein
MRDFILTLGLLTVLASAARADPAITTMASVMREAPNAKAHIVQSVPAHAVIDLSSCEKIGATSHGETCSAICRSPPSWSVPMGPLTRRPRRPPSEAALGRSSVMAGISGGEMMRGPLSTSILIVVAIVSPSGAQAIGCLTGAAAGAVAGHYAGRHAVLGAMAGCAAGHHMHKVRQEPKLEQQQQPQPPPASSGAT